MFEAPFIDSNGNQAYWRQWLVPKSVFEDGSYKQHPELGYVVDDLEGRFAKKYYDDDAPWMEVETLIFRDNYVVVDEYDFDIKARVREGKLRQERKLEKDKTKHLKQKADYEKSLVPKPRPWWRRILS